MMKDLLHWKRSNTKRAKSESPGRQDDTLKSALGLFKSALTLASTILQLDPTQIGKTVVESTLFLINEFRWGELVLV